MKKMKKLKNV